MPIKVSAVVPVSESGPHTHDCVQSLLASTMDQDLFEIVLVCGQPDQTREASVTWLEALARSHRHVRVVWTNSPGAPGQARNAGIEAAQGEYVQVIEPHERPVPEAFARLYDLGQRNQADVVLGKVASPDRQTLPAAVREVRDVMPADDAALWESLPPYALYRTAFLQQNQIQQTVHVPYLAPQMGTVQALLAAKIISVLGDQVACYDAPRCAQPAGTGSLPTQHLPAQHVVPVTGGSAAARNDPGGYAEQLRALVAFVSQHTEPGTLRDVVLRRFYRVEVLCHLGRAHNLSASGGEQPHGERGDVVAYARELACEETFDHIHAGLPLLERLHSAFVRRGDQDALFELTRRCERVEASARLQGAWWKSGRLHLSVAASLVRATDPAGGPREAVGLVRRAGHDYADPALLRGLVDEPDQEVTNELRRYRAEVTLRQRVFGAQWTVPAKLELVVEHDEPDESGTRCRLSFQGIATVDPERFAGRRPVEAGTWDVRLRVEALGLTREATVVDAGANANVDRPPPAVVGRRPQVVVPVVEDGALALDVGRDRHSLGAAVTGRSVIPQPCNGRQLVLTLPAVSRPGSTTLDVAVCLRGTDEHSSSVTVPARLVPFGAELRLVADVGDAPGPLRSVRPGTWHLYGLLDGHHGPQVEVGSVHVDSRSRIYLSGADRIGPVADLARRALAATVSRPGLRRLGLRVVDRLPDRWQRRIRRTVRRARP